MNLEALRPALEIVYEAPLAARVYMGLEGLGAIRGTWEALAGEIESGAFYHQYEWYENYVQHLEPEPGDLRFVLVSRGSRTVAILPLKYRPSPRIGHLDSFMVPFHDHLPMVDALMARDEDPRLILECILQQLRIPGSPRWDVLLVPGVSDQSCLGHALGRMSGGWLVKEYAHHSDTIPNEGGHEASAARLSGNFRRNLRKKQKHAEDLGELVYRSVESPDELEAAFSEFLSLEDSGWKGSCGTRTAIACNPRLEAFYRGLLHVRTPAMHCVINLMYLSGVCIAAEFCLFCNATLNLLKIGYLEAYPRISPGNLLLDHVLRDWCERPGLRAVSLVGDAPWQQSWHPESTPLFRYRLYNYTVRGLLVWLWRRLRPALLWLGHKVVAFLSDLRGRVSNAVARP